MSAPELRLTIRWIESPSEEEIKRIRAVFEAAFEPDLDFQKCLFQGDKSLMSLKFYSNILSAAIGGKIQVASVGPNLEDIVGAAIWFGPGQELNGTEEQRRGGGSLFLDNAPEDLRNEWLENLIPKLNKLALDSFGPDFKKDQWSLLLFGVIPEYHRKGVGKTMVRTVEDIARQEDRSLVVETHTPHDVMIYEIMGFEVKGTVAIDMRAGGFTMYQLQKTL